MTDVGNQDSRCEVEVLVPINIVDPDILGMVPDDGNLIGHARWFDTCLMSQGALPT